MKITKILSLVLALVMVLSLAACGSTPAETTATTAAPAEGTEAATAAAEQPAEGVTLTYWSMWNSNEPQGQVIAEAVAAYEAQTGVKINVEWKGRDINTILSASLEAGEKFDIFEDDYKRIGQTYAPYTYDLTEMAAAADYASHSYPCINDQAVAWAGYLNSIAEQPQIGGMFYDKDVFAQAGVEAPTTWEEFLTVCKTLKDQGLGLQALDSAYADFTLYHHLVHKLGEDRLTELSNNGGWAAEPLFVEAAQEVIDFVKAGYLVDGAPDEFPSSQNKIGYGLASMVVCGNYVTAEVNNNTGSSINWGLFNYPAVPNGVANSAAYMGCNSLAITSYSEHPQEAFDFLMFLTTGEWDQKMADTCQQIPADTRNTCPAILDGSIEALLAAEAPMSWCGALYANSSLKDSIKTLCVEIYEGKYDSGEAFAAAMDALY